MERNWAIRGQNTARWAIRGRGGDRRAWRQTPSPRNNVGGFHLSYSGSLTGVLVDAARVGRGRVEKRVGAVHASDVALGTGIERPPEQQTG